MNAGKLRHKIILQNRVSTQNPVGGRDESYVNVSGVGSLRAAYTPSGGQMYMGAGEAHTESDSLFTIRYSSIPQSGMYILLGTVRYLVLAVNDVEGKHIWLEIPCKRET